MLKAEKGKALPSKRYEKKMDLMSKSDYSLPYNSAEAEMKDKKALQKNVKNHKMKY
jgi:hypothetical protein